MTSQTGQQIITKEILPNISRSKDNRAIKFGPLIDYNIENTFLEKSCTRCGEEASLGPFYKKSNLWNSLNFIQFILLYVQVDNYQNILKLRY